MGHLPGEGTTARPAARSGPGVMAKGRFAMEMAKVEVEVEVMAETQPGRFVRSCRLYWAMLGR
jgi:hypothetical protein